MEIDAKKLYLKKDERGFVTEILKQNQINTEIKEVLFIVTKPGVTRGNHYHKIKAEWLCVIKGRALVKYEDIETGLIKEIKVSGKKPTTLKTPNNTLHSVTNIGKSDLYTIEITNQIYEEAPDTFKKE